MLIALPIPKPICFQIKPKFFLIKSIFLGILEFTGLVDPVLNEQPKYSDRILNMPIWVEIVKKKYCPLISLYNLRQLTNFHFVSVFRFETF